jgi:hypothetical protein
MRIDLAEQVLEGLGRKIAVGKHVAASLARHPDHASGNDRLIKRMTRAIRFAELLNVLAIAQGTCAKQLTRARPLLCRCKFSDGLC